MTDPPAPPRRSSPLFLVAALLVLLVCTAGLCALRDSATGFWADRFAFVISAAVPAAVLAGVYLLAALGLGRLLRPAYRDARHPWLLQFALGLALLLTLSHLLGAIGPLTNPWIARGVLALAILPLLQQVSASDMSLPGLARSVSPWLLLAMPAVALLVVASTSLPGWLWASEAHGYDVLSYHLQLPREWLAGGRLEGLEHNVYSFLPSFMEAAYLHLAAAVGSIHAQEGLVLRASQFLHAQIAVVAVVLLGRLPLVWLKGLRAARRDRVPMMGATDAANATDQQTNTAPTELLPLSGPLAATLLAIPWVIVVGSLAYNELALVLLFAAAALALADDRLSARSRCLLPALLLGAACGAKLTAAFMAALPLAVAAFFFLPQRRLVRLFLPSLALFLAPLAPYFARNMIDAGNPVFPFAPGLFGSGHWTAEQVQRWQAGHQFAGSLGDWLAALWERGAAHPQWSIFFALVLVGAIIGAARRTTRLAALLALVMLMLQFVFWALFTHIQARFLIPALAPGALLLGAAVAPLRLPASTALRAAALAALCLPALGLTGHAYFIFSKQRGGDPCYLLKPEAHAEMTGRIFVLLPQLLEQVDPTPQYVVNEQLPSSAGVYSVGGATPLYFTRPVLYHTTWDASPLGELLREHGDDYQAIAAALRERSVTHLLIDFSELTRLQGDGWHDPSVTPETMRDFAVARAERAYDWGFLVLVELSDDD